MNEKRILFTLAHPFNPNNGGVQRTTYKLGRFFEESGFDVYYYSQSHSGHIVPEWGKLSFPDGSIKEKDKVKLGKHFIEELKRIAPDILINQVPYDPLFHRELKHLGKDRKFILLGCLRNSLFSFKSNVLEIIQRQTPSTLHAITTHKFVINQVLKNHRVKQGRVIRDIMEVNDKFILLSKANEEELQYFIKDYPSEKLLAIPNSIPFVLSELPKKEKIILFVGNLNVDQKRTDLLVPFWKSLYKKLPDWKFLIIGDGDHRQEIERKIKEFGIERMELHGRKNPESYYQKSSIFVMFSAFEGFPNVLLEAQSFGLVPVVINSYLALKHIVNENIDTFMSEPFDIDEMAAKVYNLCCDNVLLNEMAKNAMQNASKYTIERVGAQWLELFSKEGITA